MNDRDLFSAPSTDPQCTRDILSVADLNRKARQLLETHLSLIWVEGELSNLANPSSGHWYFTLKDANAQVRCAMFRNRNQMVRFKPAQGQQVLLRARVSLYEGRGDYQLIVEHMEEAGFGVLQRAFDALKAKLSKEGLFDPAHKKPIPELPRHIAVITSPTGAAIHDVLTVLKRRFASIPVTIIPVQVQGQGAAAQIVKAIDIANSRPEFDVVLLCRGGGSLEDMWPFNEEIVARAVFASRLPLVCAVGHEVDFSIADFVADVRAPTPSAAAELLSPDGREWLRNFVGFAYLLGQAMQRRCREGRQDLKALSARLRHPGERLQSRAQHLDNLELRLRRSIQQVLLQQKQRFKTSSARLHRCHPAPALRHYRHYIARLNRQLSLCNQQQLKQRQHRFQQNVELLHAVSPLNTLRRGYSVLLRADGSIPRSASTVNTGELLTAKLGEGELLCRVEDKRARFEAITDTFGKLSDSKTAASSPSKDKKTKTKSKATVKQKPSGAG